MPSAGGGTLAHSQKQSGPASFPTQVHNFIFSTTKSGPGPVRPAGQASQPTDGRSVARCSLCCCCTDSAALHLHCTLLLCSPLPARSRPLAARQPAAAAAASSAGGRPAGQRSKQHQPGRLQESTLARAGGSAARTTGQRSGQQQQSSQQSTATATGVGRRIEEEQAGSHRWRGDAVELCLSLSL